ncbi:hypothetical protein BGZ80_010990 [Entomortierella chlamydospora]|uniref:Uncharacterized protein n=1 Tax=Entomortierella chlamydospora TaxID=101097 RepID=A0A9P6MUV5_9FUNG|nr:hypothetical protein BGZ80_010990 [Entomortierella chlamydospora]
MTILRGPQTLAADFTTGLMNVAKVTTRSEGHLINDTETQHNILEQQEQRQANEEMRLTDLVHRISAEQCLQEQHPQVQHLQEQVPDQWGADALGQQALSQQIEQGHEQPVQVELENQRQEEAEEWFSAKDGKPSIWSLNRYQKDWREGWKANPRNIYMLKKRIIYATLKEVKKTEGSNLMDRVLRAKAVMNARMEQAGGTPNALFKATQKRKKID